MIRRGDNYYLHMSKKSILTVLICGFILGGCQKNTAFIPFGKIKQELPPPSSQVQVLASSLGLTGPALSGNKSVFVDLVRNDYEMISKTDKIVFVYFYTNWCKSCQKEQADIANGFNELASDKVVGFRSNYKDGETQDYDDKLAASLNISYQGTKVILKNGKEVFRSQEVWNKETFLKEIGKFL